MERAIGHPFNLFIEERVVLYIHRVTMSHYKKSPGEYNINNSIYSTALNQASAISCAPGIPG